MRFRPVHVPRRLRGVSLVLAGAALVLSACAGVRSEGAPGFALRTGDTWAWTRPPHAGAEGAVDGALPLGKVERAVEAALAGRGLREVPRDEARWLVDARLDVRLELLENDPYFALYVAETYEEGALTLEVRDAATGGTAWLGEFRQRLRYVSQSMRGTRGTFVPTGDERTWHVDELVERLFAAIPAG